MQKLNTVGMVLVIIALSTILFAGCSKSTGPAGATGPQGSTGATGPAGPTGPQGNANVVVDTFKVTNSQWLYNDNYVLYTANGSYTEWFTRYYMASFSAVTQGVLDSGLVLVYMTPNINDNNQWSPVPFTYDSGDEYSYDFVYVTSPGTVELEFYFSPTASGVTTPALSTYDIPTYTFKLVAVTGSLATSMENSKIDHSNYAQVMNFLGR
jgi:hypothetical protein